MNCGQAIPEAVPGLYIHVPFCVKKCPYCGFYSVTDLSLKGAYLDALLKEMDFHAAGSGFSGFDTVYFGGGTPSLLSPSRVGAVLDSAAVLFSLSEDLSVTLEANPKTVSRKTLEDYRRAGVNRINFGVQSFNNENLKFLGRIHDAEDARKALSDARKAGFGDIGLDLIFGLFGQSPESWRVDLAEALDFSPEHLSCYMLTIEENTPFGAIREKGGAMAADDGLMADLFLLTREILTGAGYVHYEVSNYAKSAGFLSRHNMKYWNGAPYLGLGPSAHSFDGAVRSWNAKILSGYLKRVAEGGSAVLGREELSRRDQVLEALFLGLRQAAGIDVGAFSVFFGLDFFEAFGGAFERCEKEGWLQFSEGRVSPTPHGMLFCDGMARLFIESFDA